MKSDIVDSFSMMVKDKKMDRDVLESIIKDVFGMMLKKKYGLNANFDVIVNMDKGDIEMYLMKKVVKEVTDPSIEIDIESARELSGEELDDGDDYVEVLDVIAFGRRHIVNLKQNLNQRIREIEKEIVFNDYKNLLGEIIVGEIYQLKPNYVLLIHNQHEVIYPKSEQIPKERLRKGESIRVYVKDVQKKTSGPPMIVVSRSSDAFLKKLFEQEIPEIYDSVIEIKGIARDPGERAKVSVYSYDDRIDAVGACVGMKGIRIHSIVRELCNENIDVINFSEDIALYIARALAPAKLKDIYLDKTNKIAKIIADEDQISIIIGKNGQNIKLASKLTGYEIDVERKGLKDKGKEDEEEQEEEEVEAIDDEEGEEDEQEQETENKMSEETETDDENEKTDDDNNPEDEENTEDEKTEDEDNSGDEENTEDDEKSEDDKKTEDNEIIEEK